MTGIPDAWGTPLYDMLLTACDAASERHGAYERSGRLSDLELAVSGYTHVLALARNVDVRSVAVNGLGVALWTRYERFGRLFDLDTAVGLFREALAMYPDEQTISTPTFHANLAGALHLRWRRTGADADLAESVAESRAAAVATSPSDPKRSLRLRSLADGLLALALHHDDSSALREAAELSRQAVACARADDDIAGLWSNFAGVLHTCYLSTSDRDLLDEAVAQAQAAAVVVPRDHPLRPRFESNLARILVDRFVSQRRPADLAEAAARAQSAVEATPIDHPNLAERLLILSRVRRIQLSDAYGASGVPGRRAAHRIVKLANAAAAAVPDGHFMRADALYNQGSALALLALAGDETAFAAAITAFQTVAADPAAPVRARVSAGWQWANVALRRTQMRDPTVAREAFELAVALLPRTAPRRVTHADRERQLAAFSGLARDAAANAIATGDADGALRLLEHGRGVLLSHALDSRTELTGLRARRPDLAERFERLRRALDGPEGSGFSSYQSGSRPVDVGLPGEDRHALATEWDELLDEIRDLPDFAGFLQPPRIEDLISASADHGPVVVLNLSGLRCDALLLTDGQVLVLPLQLGIADVVRRAQRFRAVIASSAHSGQPAGVREEAVRTVAQTLGWLWAAVAQPVIDALQPPTGSRLWWVPTGPLTMLPLHAAAPPGGPGVLDRVVSSYAPTVRSLVTAWRTQPAAPGPGTLVVAMPTTPGLPDLPGVASETAMLTNQFKDSTMLAGEHAVRQAVLDALPRYPRVHFACHAISAADGAADGHLVLYDHATAPLTVADIARLRLDNAQVAYLSCCDTGIARASLDDEALHVAGACHMAGFRHVVGTLWGIHDGTAPTVADEFYAALDTPDAAAHALHGAVRKLRAAHPDVPALWAPYIHVGP